jgi:Family of unknown function (DUF6533)
LCAGTTLTAFITRPPINYIISQLYDFLLTLGKEIDLLWATRWNLVRVLFFVNRYSPLLDAAVLLYCVYILLSMVCLSITLPFETILPPLQLLHFFVNSSIRFLAVRLLLYITIIGTKLMRIEALITWGMAIAECKRPSLNSLNYLASF